MHFGWHAYIDGEHLAQGAHDRSSKRAGTGAVTVVTSAVYKKCANSFPFRKEEKREMFWICLWNYIATVSEEVIKLCFISKETSLYKENLERNATPVIAFFFLVCCEKAKYLSHGKVSWDTSTQVRVHPKFSPLRRHFWAEQVNAIAAVYVSVSVRLCVS